MSFGGELAGLRKEREHGAAVADAKAADGERNSARSGDA